MRFEFGRSILGRTGFNARLFVKKTGSQSSMFQEVNYYSPVVELHVKELMRQLLLHSCC